MKEMMKQKMMNRFHKRNSSSASSVDFKSGERLDFKFSSLQALQVPSGWDKLSISLISIETDKTVAKTGKASVYNGNCRWTESLLESIYISPDDSSKELQQCLYKLLISKGSTRSSILGEATVNLSSYMSSEASLPIALPLKKCEHGTILQVAIQCLTPRPNSRWSDTNSLADSSDLDNGFDTKPTGTSTTNSIRDTSNALGSRETSFVTVRSHCSFDSLDSFGKESSHSNTSDVTLDLTGRPESTSTTMVNVYNSPSSGKNLVNTRRQDSGKVSHTIPASPLRAFSSSEYVQDDDMATEELRAEARTWERNARKLMVDLELSRKVTNDQTRNLENVTMELSALQTECNELKKEIKHLKVLLGESETKERDADVLKVQVQDKKDLQLELEEELKYLKDLNSDMSMQLNKTQESNLELVSVLQELEETIEKQKLVIEDTRVEASNFTEKEKCELELQLQKLQESQEKLKEALEKKTQEIELERKLKNQTLLEIESECERKLSLKDKQISNLEAKLSEAFVVPDLEKTEIETHDLIEEVKALKDKVMELEQDCNELTDENLELLFKLKESSNNLSVSGIEDSEVDKSLKGRNGKCKLEILITDLKSKVEDLNNELFAKSSEIEEVKSDCLIKEEEIQSKSYRLKDLEAQLSDLQTVNGQLEKSLTESTRLETEHSESLKTIQEECEHLKKENYKLQTTSENLLEECGSLQKCNDELRNQMKDSEDNFLKLSKNLEDLEQKLSTMIHDIASNEEMFDSELESLNLKFTEVNSSLQNSLIDMKHENERLEASYQIMSGDFQNLKEEKTLLLEKSFSMQKAVMELEDLKHKKFSMEEKLLHLTNEVESLKKSNSQLLLKIEEKGSSGSSSNSHHDDMKLTEDVEGGGKVDESLKIQSLELSLDEALEANKMYKIQLKSLLSEKEDIVMELKKQNGSLKAELNELQERYLNMSLKYAEVEAQREDLVLKLKNVAPGRSWFS